MYDVIHIGGNVLVQKKMQNDMILHVNPITDNEFKAWLTSQKKTLEQWLQENPPPEPVPPTKEQLLAAAQEQIYRNHIAELSKMVIELRDKLAVATGVKFDPVPAELAAKLAECDSLEKEVKP